MDAGLRLSAPNPAQLVAPRGLSQGFHKYNNVIYRPPHPNPLPPKVF